jgi:hypothetical protein
MAGKQQMREVVLGDGYGSQSSLRQYFGLADQAKVDELVVRWPKSGTTQTFSNVAADRIIQITEGKPAPEALVEKHYGASQQQGRTVKPLLALLAAAAVAATAGFEDITSKAGVAVAHHNRKFENPYAHIMAGYTALGASASAADYDGDGYDDLFVTDSSADGRNHLFHNNRNLTFTDVAAQAGIDSGNDAANASADSLWFDYNNDGRPDLLVVRFGQQPALSKSRQR